MNRFRAIAYQSPPSHRLLRFARIELNELIQWNKSALDAIVNDDYDTGRQMLEFMRWLGELAQYAGGLDGAAPPVPIGGEVPQFYSAKPHLPSHIPQRDERFTDLWNQGVNAEAFLYNESHPASAKVLMMLFNRLRDIDVPEMMASIVSETPGKPRG